MWSPSVFVVFANKRFKDFFLYSYQCKNSTPFSRRCSHTSSAFLEKWIMIWKQRYFAISRYEFDKLEFTQPGDDCTQVYFFTKRQPMNIFAVYQDNRGTCCIYFIYIMLVGSCSFIFYICVADLTFYRETIEI